MPLVDDMEEESRQYREEWNRTLKQYLSPVLRDFRVTLKRSVFIRVFPQTVNCQTVTLRTDVIDLFHDILYLSKIFLAKQLLKQDFLQRFTYGLFCRDSA